MAIKHPDKHIWCLYKVKEKNKMMIAKCPQPQFRFGYEFTSVSFIAHFGWVSYMFLWSKAE